MKKLFFAITTVLLLTVPCFAVDTPINSRAATGVIADADSIPTHDASANAGATRTVEELKNHINAALDVETVTSATNVDRANTVTNATNVTQQVFGEDAAYYYPDDAAADQGATDATYTTIYEIAQTVGTASTAVIVLQKGSLTGTANFAFNTSLNLSTYPNLFFIFQPGARLTRTTGDEVLTLYSPGNLSVFANQQITAVDMIDFTEPGTIYPEWWGAKGNGVTDDSNAFNYAALSLNDVGGDLVLSRGVYIASDLVTYGGINWKGPGRDVCEVRETAGTYTLSVNKGSGGTTSVAGNEKNIEITGIHFSGAVATLAFSEHAHVLNFNAVSDLWVHNCKISGFRGDGIYLGSSNTAATERHNENVLIENNIIDGIANDNRNGISVIDCNNLVIRNNIIKNTTKATMPGAIDIEPDANVFHILRNITIKGNTIQDCGGNVANIALVLNPETFTNQPEVFRIINNRFLGTSNTGVYVSNTADYARHLDIIIQGNGGTVTRPFYITGLVEGLKILDNSFTHTAVALLGFDATDTVKNAKVRGNYFLGDGVTAGLVVRSCDGLIISDNHLIDNADYAILLGMAGATIDSLTIHSNHFLDDAVGIEFGAGTFTLLRILHNDLTGATAKLQGSIPGGTIFRDNAGYVTKAAGAASVGHAGTIAHGLATTPTVVSLTSSTGGNIVTSAGLDATNITINVFLHDGTTVAGAQTIYWEAELIY